MEVEHNAFISRSKKYSELKVGEVFYRNKNGDYNSFFGTYIKVVDDFGGSFSLEENVSADIPPEEEVIPVKAKVVVGGSYND